MCRYDELFSQLKRALELMEQTECEQARELLNRLGTELEEDDENKELLGEWNLLMARMHFFELDKAIAYLKKAREMIDGKSKVVPYGTDVSMVVYGPLFIFLQVPGTADATGKKLEQMMKLYDSLCGGISRYDQIYYAQLAYYRGEFDKALDLFLKVERSAKKTGNALDQLCVAEYRTRIAFHMRDSLVWNQEYNIICGMQNNENRMIRELAACMKSQIQMSLGRISGIPKWIKCGKFGAISEGRHYRMVEDRVSYSVFPIAWLTYMEYLLYGGDFYRVINGADIAASLYGLNWMMLYDGYLKIYKASAWNALGNQERTEDYLRKAVKIMAPDGLWVFGAEFFTTLGDKLMKEIEPFGQETIEKYLTFSKEYSGKLMVIRNMLEDSVFGEPLTEKEQAVARLAALGFKNEEIGDQLFISRNTVKYHLANIYKKLEINNRVELREALEAQRESEYAYWIGLNRKET